MTGEARELHRVVNATVRDMLSAYRIQAQVGQVSEQALEAIFRAAHPIVNILAPYIRPISGPRCRASCASCWRPS